MKAAEYTYTLWFDLAFYWQPVFPLGKVHRQRLLRGRTEMVLQVSEAESNKYYLCCGTGTSCPLASPFNWVLQETEKEREREREINIQDSIKNLNTPVPKPEEILGGLI